MGMYVDVVADGSLEEVALPFLVQSSLTVVWCIGALVQRCSHENYSTTVSHQRVLHIAVCRIRTRAAHVLFREGVRILSLGKETSYPHGSRAKRF